MKTVMVTGAGGFIGQHTVKMLTEAGYQVLPVADRVLRQGIFWIPGDIRSEEEMESIFSKTKPDAVIHLAAQSAVTKSWEEPVLDAQTNILGTINVVQACKRYGVKRIVYAGSGGTVYGQPEVLPAIEDTPVNPQSPYGLSKYAGECYVKMSGISHAILRYPNVYGSGQDPKGAAGVIAMFIGKMLKNERCTIYGTGKQRKDYVYIDDVVNANILALESEANGIFNIGSGGAVSLHEIHRLVAECIGFDKTPIYEDQRPGDVQKFWLDATKAHNQLGWTPMVELGEGIRRTVDAMRVGREGEVAAFHGGGELGSNPRPAIKE